MPAPLEKWYLRCVWLLLFLSPMVWVEPAPYDVLLLLLLGVGLAFSQLKFRAPMLWPLLLLCLFLAGNFISLCFVQEISRGIRYLGITVYLILSWFFFAGLIGRFGSKALSTIFSGYTAGAVLWALLSSLAALKWLPWWDKFVFIDTGGQLRAQGLFKDPNVLGAFLVPAAVYALLQGQKARGKHRALWAVIFSSITVGVFLSFSRAAWGNYFLAVAIFFLLPGRQALRERIILYLESFALSAALIALLLRLPSIGGYLSRRLGKGDPAPSGPAVDQALPPASQGGGVKLQDYDQQRFSIQKAALDTLSHNWLGIGPGQSEVVFNYATHSVYLRVLVENGLLGISFIIFTILPLLRSLIHGLKQRTWLTFSAAVLTGQLFNGFFIDALHWRHLWLFLAIAWVVKGDEA